MNITHVPRNNYTFLWYQFGRNLKPKAVQKLPNSLPKPVPKPSKTIKKGWAWRDFKNHVKSRGPNLENRAPTNGAVHIFSNLIEPNMC